MTHGELVKELAGKLEGKSQKDVAEFLKVLAETVHETVKKGEKVVLKDLVTIETKVSKAHTARNPRTGEPVDVPEKTVPVVKATSALKEVVK